MLQQHLRIMKVLLTVIFLRHETRIERLFARWERVYKTLQPIIRSISITIKLPWS